MTNIVTTPFLLNTNGILTTFAVGDLLTDAQADHWYAKLHSKSVDEPAPVAAPAPEAPVIASPAPAPVAVADETKAVKK